MSSHETEFDAVVVSRQPAADSIDVFELARVDGTTLPSWQAGAHLDLVLPSGDERQYSLLPPATAPVLSSSTDASTWRIAVLREPSGRGGSLWLHESLTAVGCRGAYRVARPDDHDLCLRTHAIHRGGGGVGRRASAVHRAFRG